MKTKKSKVVKLNPRFVLNIGAIHEQYPDMPEQEGWETVLWDRQEKKPVVTIHEEYASAICLETTRMATDAPISLLEKWFNGLDNRCLESEGITPTKSEFMSGQRIWHEAFSGGDK